VSTNVGGIPEVLPETMINLSEPNVKDLINSLRKAIQRHKLNDRPNHFEMHERIKQMYNWRNIAKRTEIVYNDVVKSSKKVSLIDKLLK
jgi:phosphatidylinositol N-acetylglucosaminyltransferase subunit A